MIVSSLIDKMIIDIYPPSLSRSYSFFSSWVADYRPFK